MTAAIDRVRVDLGLRGYDVVVGGGAIAELTPLLEGRRRVAIVSQAAIARVYEPTVVAAAAASGATTTTLLMGEGESAKTMETVEELARGFAGPGVLRGDAVVALGGGVVGDTAAFTAAIYARGIDVVQVPTTLLAMVDSAIGGKTGVNLPEGKNLVGAFHQPLAVLADPTVLETLPDRELRRGLGEVVKYALLGDRDLAALLDERADALLERDTRITREVVIRCARAKATVVAADELERTGVRASLNLGHTVGHALEIASGHTLAHGEAVAVGLVFAFHLAGVLERLSAGAVDRAERLVARLGLPVAAPGGLHVGDLLATMALDKKSVGGLTFVLPGPNGIERVDDPDPAAVRKAFAAIGVHT